MNKPLPLFALLFILMATLQAAIITNPSSGTANVGENIWVRVDCQQPGTCLLLWGDGASYTGTDSDFYGGFYHSHAYKNPGAYTMHYRRYPAATPACPSDEYRTVTIIENRSIEVSPNPPSSGLLLTFTAVNFNTPDNVTWDMGDGNVYARRGTTITYAYGAVGTYTVRAYDWDGNVQTTPVTLVLNLTRNISFSPAMPMVDEPVEIRANGFSSAAIEWNFGDQTPPLTLSSVVSHRHQNPGTFTITAQEQGLNLAPVSRTITILPENRSLLLSSQESRPGEPLTVTAVNFRSSSIHWDFGDRTVVSGPPVMTHAYQRPGNYTITARDENGASEKQFQAQVKILGVSDQVDLEIAEIALDNGKYYKVIPRNSRTIRAQLRMKLRGTGIVSGYWIVDGQPYQFFNETVYQGQIRTILTPEIPGLPAFDPGMHTVTMQLTRPRGDAAVFPILRYFVLPFENLIEALAPQQGAVIKENQVVKFSWQNAAGGALYQIAFADSPFSLMRNDAALVWLDCPDRLDFTPDRATWRGLRRNQPTYWKVRALDSAGNVVAESDVQEIKIIIPGAEIGLLKVTNMDGREIALGENLATAPDDQLIIHGQLTYPGEAEYLILRIYANDELVNQLLFRDVKKDMRKTFETSVPNPARESRVVFEVLKSSSPSVVIGYAELRLKKE